MKSVTFAVVPAFALGFLTCYFWNGSREAVGNRAADGGKQAEIQASANKTTGSRVEENGRGRRERTDTQDHRKSAIGHFEALAEISPGLIQRLNLNFALLDSSMDANVDNWEMLGIDRETATGIADGIKATLAKHNKEEARSAQKLEYSDSVAKFYLPRLDPATARPFVEEIEGKFSTVFGKALSQELTKSLLERSPNTAGLVGKDRVITVTLTSDEVLEKTQRSYEVRWQVMLENNIPLSERLENIDRMSSYDGRTIFEETPDYLKELIDGKGQ